MEVDDDPIGVYRVLVFHCEHLLFVAHCFIVPQRFGSLALGDLGTLGTRLDLNAALVLVRRERDDVEHALRCST